MVHLEYDSLTRQVIEIHETEPTDTLFCVSNSFQVGDEFELTIWVNEIGEEKELLSHSAIRNNPNAKRLLRDNALLKTKTTQQEEQIAEKDRQIIELKEKQTLTSELVESNGLQQQELLELLIDMGVI